VDAGSKQCSGPCGQFKPLAAFSFKNLAQGRRHGVCRECYKAWNRAHYERNRATYIANARRNTVSYRADTLRRLADYLRHNPCVDCGETDLLVLEFDHRDPSTKRMSVSSMLEGYSWLQIEAEIGKCDVRCANCHRRRTARQFGWRKLALTLVGEQADPAGAAGLEPTTSNFGDWRSTN
jgi:hypothetical protein